MILFNFWTAHCKYIEREVILCIDLVSCNLQNFTLIIFCGFKRSSMCKTEALVNGDFPLPLQRWCLCFVFLPELLASVCCAVVSDSVTLWTVARQAPLSMGRSRQEHWSGLPCPLQGRVLTQGLSLCLLHWLESPVNGWTVGTGGMLRSWS